MPTTLLLRVSVILSAVAGFAVGLTLLWSTAAGAASSLPFAALAQAHGQVQTLGFVGLFILGTAAQLLPGFLTSPLRQRNRFVAGGLLLAAALTLRIVAQPLGGSLARGLALGGFGVLQLVGILLCLSSLADLVRRTIQPPETWRYLAYVAFGFLALTALLNVAAAASLVGGAGVVPDWLDSAIVTAELPGFAVFSALAVGWKIFQRFLLLQPTNRPLAIAGSIAYFVGTLVALGTSLLGLAYSAGPAQAVGAVGAWLALVGIVAFVGGIKLFQRPSRASGAPAVTEPTRRWIRIAFGWLILANVVGAVLATRPILGGSWATYLEVAATRHALGQGFVLTLIVAMAARIVPGVSAWAATHPALVESTIAILTLGALLRVFGELASPLGELSLAAAALGGSFGTLGFLGFGWIVVRTVGTPRVGKRP